jgi:hypothetical protein
VNGSPLAQRSLDLLLIAAPAELLEEGAELLGEPRRRRRIRPVALV